MIDIFLNFIEKSARYAGTRGRYAPSPTGPLHLGNLRTGLLSWLQIRLLDGVFILRMEDLDTPRVKPGSAQAILADLKKLGIDWDEGPDKGGPLGPYDQSSRTHIYQAALDQLQHQGRVYPCYCSRKEVAQASSAPHGASPVYPGRCRDLNGHVPPGKEDRRPSIRYRIPAATIRFCDLLMGPQCEYLPQSVGDFILRRADNLFAYQLAVVVDDAAMGVTHVLRGEDLLSSSARQIQLFQTFGQPAPQFMHVPLMLDERGARMSKRDGSQSLQSLFEAGRTPAQIIGDLAASIKLIEPNRPLSAAELLQELRGRDDPFAVMRQSPESA